MRMSHITLNRLVEEHAAQDEAYRRKLERRRRPLLSHGRAMSDDALMMKLEELGVFAQRDQMLLDFPRFISAEAMSKALIATAKRDIPEAEVDWVWIATTCLWERWYPSLPNTEMVDDKMQAGYAALATFDSVGACRLWLEAWRAIVGIIDRAGMTSLDEFDERFGGTQSLYNWVQDLEIELHNAGIEEPEFLRERIALCESLLDRFSNGSIPLDNFKVLLAASHFELGECETGDGLFRRWMAETPHWGPGWISWSECFWERGKRENMDAPRAEQILQEGLASPGVTCRREMLERLQRIYEETGKHREACALHEQIADAQRLEATASAQAADPIKVGHERDFADEAFSLSPSPEHSHIPGYSAKGGHRVGRNEPCPCGSGKKFKKCCARKRLS